MSNDQKSVTSLDLGGTEATASGNTRKGSDRSTDLDGSQKSKEQVKTLPVSIQGEKCHRILISKGESDDDKEAVFVGFNGEREFIVPRGLPVVVPDTVYNILLDSKRTVLTEEGAENYEAPRFNIQYLGEEAA